VEREGIDEEMGEREAQRLAEKFTIETPVA
jgi:hypothetical protein